MIIQFDSDFSITNLKNGFCGNLKIIFKTRIIIELTRLF